MQLALTSLLLAACAHPSDKGGPPAPSDSDPTETGESADSRSYDTQRDSTDPDSGDTGESAETGDTGTAADPDVVIPGWDDLPCDEPYPGRAMSFQFPDLFQVTGVFLSGQSAGGPHVLTIQLDDCTYFECTGALDTSLPYAEAVGDATWGDAGLPRGLGDWGPDDTAPRHVVGIGNAPVGSWSNTTSGVIGEAGMCIERMRPDEVRGVVRVDLDIDSSGDLETLRFPFSIRLDEHAGFDTTLPDTGDAPPGYSTAHFEYDVPYDEAWPWDEITDPKVRDDLYDRYTPYNAP